MQKVAMELNLSETAFVVGQQGDYHIRWFTPATEVDFCGHATLAAAHVICRELGYQEGEVNFSSRIGLLTVNQEGSQLCLKGPAMASEAYTLSNELASYLPTEPIEALSNPNQDLMIVMPSLSVREQCDPPVVSTVIGRRVVSITPHVGDGIDRPGRVP